KRFGGRAPITVLLQVWSRPIYTVGGTQMMSDSLRVRGARDNFGGLKTPGPAVDVEAIIARNPQAIVAVAPPGTANDWLAEWKRFSTLSAVKNGALIPFEDQRLSRLGPSAVGGTEALCEALDAKGPPRKR